MSQAVKAYRGAKLKLTCADAVPSDDDALELSLRSPEELLEGVLFPENPAEPAD